MSRLSLIKALEQIGLDYAPDLTPAVIPSEMAKVRTFSGPDGMRHVLWPERVIYEAIERIEDDRLIVMKYKILLDGLKKEGLDRLHRHIMHEDLEHAIFVLNRER